MMKITVIALGKLKENYLKTAGEEYTKRLSRYCDLKIEEISPEPISDNPGKAEVEAALGKEAEKIIKRIPKNAAVVAMCVEGKSMTSENFADIIGKYENSGKSLCFVIGSSFGLHKSVKEKADLRLSLSQMTFPHALFRVILFEQIYRAFKINEGGAYHK